MKIADLPYVDEHTTVIAADVGAVWDALTRALDRAFSHGFAVRYARLIGCDDRRVSGPRPLAEGSTMAGFHVDVAVPVSELVITGRHRFSTYALSFRLEPAGPRQSRLHAETRADFPGIGGRVYRLFIIGTGGHVVAVRRLLSRVKRQTENDELARR